MNTKKLGTRRAVSPIVATLILIIIAIVGAVTVGLIMSGIGSATSRQASVGNIATQASTQIVVASSSSAYPTITALATSFETANPSVQVVVDQTGSPNAMVAVATGAAEIGISSDIGTYQGALTQYPTADLTASEMGAGAMVVIEHGSTSGSFLSDGVNPCYGITQAALQTIFQLGTFSIEPSACAAYNTLDVGGITTGTTYTAYVGPDEIAAQGTVAKYLGVTPIGTSETTEALVESAVTSHPNSIAFIEQGFNLNSAGNVVLAQPQVDTLFPTLNPSLYLVAGASAKLQQSNILAALTSSSNTQWPDNLALTSGVAPGNLLTNHFQMVTKGIPDTLAEEFIQFVTSPVAVSVFTSNGLFSVYQYNPVTSGAAPLIVFSADSYVAESQTMETAFSTATGIAMAPPFGAGSSTLATDIRSGTPVSVFMSISKSATGETSSGLLNYAPGWSAAIATDQMVIAYSSNPSSTSSAAQATIVSDATTASGASGATAINDWDTFFTALVSSPTVKVGIANPDSDPAGYRGWLVLELADANYHLQTTPTAGVDTVPCTATTPFTVATPCIYEQSEDTSATPTLTAPGNWIPYYTHELYFTNSGSCYCQAAHAAAIIGPLQAGSVNFLFMYKSLAVSSGLSYISLPTAINLASTTAPTSPNYPYNGVEYISPTGLTTQLGGVIELFLTVPTDSTNTAASNSYVAYVLTNYKTLLASYAVAPLGNPQLFLETSGTTFPTVISNAVTGYSACSTITACETVATF